MRDLDQQRDEPEGNVQEESLHTGAGDGCFLYKNRWTLDVHALKNLKGMDLTRSGMKNEIRKRDFGVPCLIDSMWILSTEEIRHGASTSKVPCVDRPMR